ALERRQRNRLRLRRISPHGFGEHHVPEAGDADVAAGDIPATPSFAHGKPMVDDVAAPLPHRTAIRTCRLAADEHPRNGQRRLQRLVATGATAPAKKSGSRGDALIELIEDDAETRVNRRRFDEPASWPPHDH